jgi:endogenous inhibitor of DNA gyrase (YacG/DUF329 family)
MSEDRDPRVVFVATELRAADEIGAWLGTKGFKCEVVPPENPAAPPDGLGLTEHAPPGIEIRVLDIDDAEKARQTIDEQREVMQAIRAAQERRANRTGTVTAACEECGKSSEWQASDMGSTQDCPHCGKYMDVPDPEDDWGDVDFGTEDEELPPADPKPAD